MSNCSLNVCTKASWEIESQFAEQNQKPATRAAKIPTAGKPSSRFGSEENHMLCAPKRITEGYGGGFEEGGRIWI